MLRQLESSAATGPLVWTGSSRDVHWVVKHTNDGDIVLGSLELPEGNVDSDTTLTLGLQLVQNPGVLEGTLAKLSGYLDGWSA